MLALNPAGGLEAAVTFAEIAVRHAGTGGYHMLGRVDVGVTVDGQE
jgi:hypothetical protein